jgi:hypothetical protein
MAWNMGCQLAGIFDTKPVCWFFFLEYKMAKSTDRKEGLFWGTTRMLQGVKQYANLLAAHIDIIFSS